MWLGESKELESGNRFFQTTRDGREKFRTKGMERHEVGDGNPDHHYRSSIKTWNTACDHTNSGRISAASAMW